MSVGTGEINTAGGLKSICASVRMDVQEVFSLSQLQLKSPTE